VEEIEETEVEDVREFPAPPIRDLPGEVGR
jgi:hypothetical protein